MSSLEKLDFGSAESIPIKSKKFLSYYYTNLVEIHAIIFGTGFILQKMTAVFSGSHCGLQYPALHVSVGHSLDCGQSVLLQQVGHVGGGTGQLQE